MLEGRDVERNGPETGGCPSTGDEDGVVLDDLNIVLGEKRNAVVVTELSQRYKSTGLEVVENEGRLRLGAETRRQWEDATESGGHDSTAGGKDLWAIGNWGRLEKMNGVGASDEGTGGARIKNDLRWGWAIYERKRRIIWLYWKS
jgi:hypothetical protein